MKVDLEALERLLDTWGDVAADVEPETLRAIIAELRAGRALAEEARYLSQQRCMCEPCWTSRNRHSPRGCLFEDVVDLTSLLHKYDEATKGDE